MKRVNADTSWLAGGGEMGERIRSFDWARTPLGPLDEWPQALKSAVTFCLGSAFPMAIWWGRERTIQIYNDGYIAFLGPAKHPAFLGRSGSECWEEIWPTLGGLWEEVFETGEASWFEDFHFAINRRLPREEGFFTFSYNPIRGPGGGVDGIFCACYETTAKVVGARRLETLRRLGEQRVDTGSVSEACAKALAVLRENPHDVPFAHVHLVDEEGRLAADPGTPQVIAPDALDAMLETHTPQEVGGLELPGAVWPEPVTQAVALPLLSAAQDKPAGVIVLGISPRRPLDVEYRTFLSLIAGQVSTTLANARAREEDRGAAESTARHNAIVEFSDDAIISKDLDGIITSWNRGAEHVFGYTAREAIGQPVTMLMPPDRVDEEPGILERIRRGDKIDHYETIRRRKDGAQLVISLSVSPVFDAQGKIVGASKIARDITHRKQSEERLRLLWEAAEVLLTASDPNAMLRGLFARIAPHFGLDAYFNYLVDESGDTLRMASSGGISDETARSIERLAFGQAVCGTVAVQRRPIHATHIQQSDDPKVQRVKSLGIRTYACSPLLYGGQLLGTLSFASRTRDQLDPDELSFLATICQYVTVSYERLRLLDRLKEADRRKDEFLATLAHELRNPLAPIRNSLHVLRLAGGDGGAADGIHEMMERQVEHLVRLVDDLMEVSRITRGKIELRKDRVELADVVRSAVETSRPLIESARHQLTISLPAEPLILDADPVRLAQVLANLLNNAAKYTDEGGQIWLSVRREGSQAVVSVRDDGIGIPGAMLPKIFDLFTQVERVYNRAYGGLGIGLTLVRSLVSMHGGSVEARSEGAGKGSEFTVRLPLAARQVDPADPARRSASSGAAAPLRILVVDDNRDAADSLSLVLKFLGADVFTVYDGPSALAALTSYRPSVVFLDMGMPVMDGYEVARRARQHPQGGDLTLIALSGWGQEEDRRRSKEAGVDHHLVKPVDMPVLERLLEGLAAKR